MSQSPAVIVPGGPSPWFVRLRVLLYTLVVDGPAPLDPARPQDASRGDSLLPWPVRLLIVLGATVVALVWAGSPAGIQIGWALQYGLLVAVAIVMSFWFPILVANTALAAVWLWLSWNPPTAASAQGAPEARAVSSTGSWDPLDLVTWLNRQVGHVEALAAWIAVAFVVSHHLVVQTALFAAVLVLSGPIVNGIAGTRWFGGEAARRSRAALMMERRSVIYGASLLGLTILALQAPAQVATILPLLVTVVPGLALRYARFRRRKSQELTAGGPSADNNPVRTQRLQRAERQHQAARAGDTAVAALTIATFFVASAGLSIYERHKIAVGARSDDDGPPPPADRCAPEPGGPVVPTLALFLLADTQIHELGGRPFPGQMEVADALVPVTRRPVELDMLSTAALVRYQAVYRALGAERQQKKLPPPLWAHLGDFADLSCAGEMDRTVALLADLGPGTRSLAGIAPGNHDMSFQGNFGWSPYWNTACTKNLDKTDSDRKMAALLEQRLVPGGVTRSLRHWSPAAPFGTVPAARFTVARLGVVPGEGAGRSHGVVAVFVDTADRQARDFGIAGSFGAFSERQSRAIEEELKQGIAASHQGQDGSDPFGDPWFVLFAHHPYDELTGSSRRALDRLIVALDAPGVGRCHVGDRACDGPRVLALVTAHTHIAQSHRHCVGQRLVREIVVGSVIDPPEQASWLEIGTDAHGHGALRLSTLPSVARPGFVCSQGRAIDAGVCRRAVGVLTAAPACQALVADHGGGDETAESCESLERPLSVADQLQGVVRHGGPTEDGEIRKAERRRALALLDCVCRDLPDHPAPPACAALRTPEVRAAPLWGEAYAPIVASLARDPVRQEELTCLAWAAADLQQHKATGMTMADAVRCAFDDPTLPAAQVTVASREDVPCR